MNNDIYCRFLSVNGGRATCHPAPHHQNLGHQSGVQLLPAPEVSQHHTTPDSVPPQHSGRPPVHSHPVLLGRPVPVFRNHVHTVNSEYSLLIYTGKITTCNVHVQCCFQINFSCIFSHEIYVKISSCEDESI